MSLYGKFSLGLVFLLIAGVAQLRAQSTMFDRPGQCRSIAVVVTDSTGAPIVGATVVPEDSIDESRTNSQGIADVPCRSIERIRPVVNVSAPGYRSAKTALVPDARSMFEVRLDRNGSVSPSAGRTVNASELKYGVQKQSMDLQKEAEKSLAAKDYADAEKLFLEALQLTPSEATISNNLGVIAMNRNDLESAGSWFQKASEEAPYTADILGNLGLVRWMQHRNDESYTALVKAFSYGYETSLGHYILGTIGLVKGNSEEAAGHLKKVSTDRFPYRDLYLSIALRCCGKTKAADESYRSFLRRNPAPFLISSLR